MCRKAAYKAEGQHHRHCINGIVLLWCAGSVFLLIENCYLVYCRSANRNASTALSLKTPCHGFFTFGFRDCARHPRHARLRVPSIALNSKDRSLGYQMAPKASMVRILITDLNKNILLPALNIHIKPFFNSIAHFCFYLFCGTIDSQRR